MRFRILKTSTRSFKQPVPEAEQGTDEYWYIEIKDLESLLALVNTHGPIVLSQDDPYGSPEIEIYDDYRE